MKILTWNIRGSGSSDKRRIVKRLLCRVNPDLVVLQEVKREVADRQLIGSLWKSRFKEWLLLPSVGRAGGILIIWDVRSVRVIDSLVGEFSVSIRIEDEQEKCWFTGYMVQVHTIVGDCFGMKWQDWEAFVGINGV